jgi:FlaA1/EpsC-like NDP-sugar epimerase
MKIRGPWLHRGSTPSGLRTLVVGAGSAGQSLAKDLRRSAEYGLRPVGFLDDDNRKRMVAGLRVLGRVDALPWVARAVGAQAVVIALPSAPATRVREIGEMATKLGLRVRTLPSFLAALERDARAEDLRALRVHDLLGRSEVHVVRSTARSTVRGRRVLVTGAGGSIGSELCRQIRGFDPAQLYLLDHDESNLHRLQLEITGEGLLDSDEIIIADIRDRGRVYDVFDRLRPEVVFHAAAHKHLPLLERHPCEGVKTNVLGTANLVEAAILYGTERFLLISTDKAADPTSVLGATKRLAEMVVQAHAVKQTSVGSVRFGNVLGSRGSFLSVLSDQVLRGEPVTVTHPDVTRFFMTVDEAVGLVLEAASMADMGETFVLDMGEPVRIVDLVYAYAAQMHVPGVDIRFTGLRPGEKLHERVFSERERRIGTGHPKIWATRADPVPSNFGDLLDQLYDAAGRNESAQVRQLMTELLPGYEAAAVTTSSHALAAPYPDGF